jgi:predicted GH43/DUF377 family glycosyl hydrolase
MTTLFLLFVTVLLCTSTAFFLSRGGNEKKKSLRSPHFDHDHDAPGTLARAHANPILPPGEEPWEVEAALNPAAIYDGERTHLLYRAIGTDGVSRLGYASSQDGVHFDDRLPYPVFVHSDAMPRSGMRYDPGQYGSGGSWSGVEDPRAVLIEDQVHVTYNAFNGWGSMRVAYTQIPLADLQSKQWNFTKPKYLSPAGERHKNWVLFPEKINGMFALFHNLSAQDNDRVAVEYIKDLATYDPERNRFESRDPHSLPDNQCAWHYRTRSIGPPPVRTPFGWLSFYHAMDPMHPSKYKMGALLHDDRDPTRVLARAPLPVLEPEAAYEAEHGVKPGIIYACGAVVKGDELIIYYGSSDTFVCAAATSLKEFVTKLLYGEPARQISSSAARRMPVLIPLPV